MLTCIARKKVVMCMWIYTVHTSSVGSRDECFPAQNELLQDCYQLWREATQFLLTKLYFLPVDMIPLAICPEQVPHFCESYPLEILATSWHSLYPDLSGEPGHIQKKL